MKILVCHKVGGAFGFITDSWLNALRYFGHDARRWDGQLTTWKSFDPDAYIGCSGHRQPIPAKRRAKVAIHVNPHGPVNLGPINEPSDAITWTLAQKPDAVFGYGWTTDANYWSYWTERHGVPWVPMATAGDLCQFRIREIYEKPLDFAYVGGNWGYKAKNIAPYLYPLMSSDLKHVVRGWGEWPAQYGVTGIEDHEVAPLFRSAKVAPCISEPHTHQYGIDIPERVFKTILSGALAVHDNTAAIKHMVPSVPVAPTPERFKDLVRHFAEDRDHRIVVQNAQYREVLNAHTYHHRMITLFRALKFDVAQMQAELDELIASCR